MTVNLAKPEKPRFHLKSDIYLSDETNGFYFKKCKNYRKNQKSKFTFSKLPKRPCRIAALIVKFTK